MSLGTGAKLLSNLPSQPFVIDPPKFFKLTTKLEDLVVTKAWPGFGAPLPIELPHADIVAMLTISFEGNVAGAAAGVEDPNWAYRLLKEIRFSGSGSTDLQAASGMDYHVLRFMRNVALNRGVEFYSTTPDENGNFRVAWDVPLASDMTSLVGALWGQSQAQQLTLELRTATAAELGLTGAPVLTGNFKINRVSFAAPFADDGSGKLVIPDLSRVHGVIAKDIPFANTGKVSAPFDHLQAQLMRALSYVDLGSAAGTANPVNYAAVTPQIEKITFRFGGKQTPLEWEPAWLLAKRNAEHYGSMLPTGYAAIDFVRENAPRDIVVLPGLTDPELVHEVRAGTVLAANSKIRLVQEVLYIP